MTISEPREKRPWHLWVVAILTLLWNGSGAVTILMAQAGLLPNMDSEETAYYAAQPLWFVVATSIALLGPLVGAVLLLVRSRTAVLFFAVPVVAIVVNNLYDLVAGTSLMLIDRGWITVTALSVVIAVLQFIYASSMRKRAVLR